MIIDAKYILRRPEYLVLTTKKPLNSHSRYNMEHNDYSTSFKVSLIVGKLPKPSTNRVDCDVKIETNENGYPIAIFSCEDNGNNDDNDDNNQIQNNYKMPINQQNQDELETIKIFIESAKNVVAQKIKNGFIAVDGINGCGKSTFVKAFVQKYGLVSKRTPDYTTPLGSKIKEILKESPSSDKDFMMYANLQEVLYLPGGVCDLINSKTGVIIDRWTGSFSCYNNKVFDMSNCPKPDYYFIIDCDAETAMKRIIDRNLEKRCFETRDALALTRSRFASYDTDNTIFIPSIIDNHILAENIAISLEIFGNSILREHLIAANILGFLKVDKSCFVARATDTEYIFYSEIQDKFIPIVKSGVVELLTVGIPNTPHNYFPLLSSRPTFYKKGA